MQGDRSGYRALIPTAHFSRVGIGAAVRDANATEAGLDQVCGGQHPARRNQDTLASQRAADIDNPRKLKIRLNRSTDNLLIHLTIHARIHTENEAFFLPLSLGRHSRSQISKKNYIPYFSTSSAAPSRSRRTPSRETRGRMSTQAQIAA